MNDRVQDTLDADLDALSRDALVALAKQLRDGIRQQRDSSEDPYRER